jgi:hypothetical protein
MDDRKYKQRGYSESPASTPRRPPGAERPASPPPERGEKPRGRGLGSPSESVFRCARCGEAAAIGSALAFEARCAGCGTDLHTCTNCTAFDPGARFECRREIAQRVSPKDRANRCEQFDPRARQEFAQEKPKPGDARSAFDALFKL